MELIPIIIVILIISAIRNAVEQAKKKQKHPHSSGQREKQTEETAEQSKPREAQFDFDRTRDFVDEKIERYRERTRDSKVDKDSKEKTKKIEEFDLASGESYSAREEYDKLKKGSHIAIKEMTSSKNELKKGVLWKEILDKPKFKQKYN